MKSKRLIFNLPISLLFLFLVSACGDMIAEDKNVEDLEKEYGQEYEVWGGPSDPSDCLNPQNDGFTKLGQSNETTQFFGSYARYVIVTLSSNYAFVDAVENDLSTFNTVSYSCNTNDDWNITSGPEPDGSYALVGNQYFRGEKGAIVLAIPTTWIRVHITPGSLD